MRFHKLAAIAVSIVPALAQQVIVTGVYEPIPLEEADRSLRVIETKSLELVSNSIADLLRLDSSLDLRGRAPDAVQSDLSIRGGSFGQTLVLLDGFRLNDAQSGHHNMDVPVPLDLIQRVEILKGSGSTLYGSDAVGGVVNFITAPPETSEFRVRAGAGNFGVNQQSAIVSLAEKNWSEQLSASRDFSSGFLPDRDYRNLSLASVTHIHTGIGFTDLVLSNNDRPFGADQFYGNYNSWERTRTWFVGLRQELGKRTEVSFAYRRHTDLFVLFRDNPQYFTNRHATEGYQATVRRNDTAGKNVRIHYGLEGYRDSIDSNNLGRHDRDRGAGYVSFDARALRRFSFTAGVREEIYGNRQSQFSPSASAGYWAASWLKFRASASHAFRLPSYTDLYYHDPANVGSPNLKPEKAWSYEGGLDWNWWRLRGDVTVFERRETNDIDYVRYSLTDVWRATNFDRLNFTGSEVSVKWDAPKHQLIEMQYSALHGAQSGVASGYSKYTFNYPIQSGLVSWQAMLPAGIVTRVRLGALERYARDPYGVLDVYAAMTRGRIHPFLQLTNLTDTVYQEIFGVPMPGRAVVGGVEIQVFRK